MKTIGNFFKNLVKNPKTSALGLSGLIAVGFAAATNPVVLADPSVITSILASAGLLVAADTKTENK